MTVRPFAKRVGSAGASASAPVTKPVSPGRKPRAWTAWASLAFSALGVVSALSIAAVPGCKTKSLEERARAAGSNDLPGGLTPELGAKVLAKVGDKEITLAEFGATLDRMNEFDRMRYQSPEKRRELLNEMIDLELLAAEAKKRGLDQRPETQEATRQIYRDAMLAEARKGLPTALELPAEEIRAYYDAHKAEFREPERRRVSAIVFRSEEEAKKALPEAQKASPMDWGRLAQKASEGALKPSSLQPLETLGDLGIVGPPDDPKGDNPRVPAEVRAAAFTLPPEVGAVLDKPVAAGGKFYLIKLAGRSPGHDRSFAEAERGIRGMVLQEKMDEREKAMEAQLRKELPVTIDDAALAAVKLNDAPVTSASVSAPAPAASASK
jgi:peptidyl-prolyl cis-trans isomerase C